MATGRELAAGRFRLTAAVRAPATRWALPATRARTPSYAKSTPTGQWSEPRVFGQMKAFVTRFAALGEAST